MKCVSQFLLVMIATAGAARPAPANSVASLVQDERGVVYFSDYRRNCLWRVDSQGRRTVLLPGVHTHHLAMDTQGNLYGEYVPVNAADPLRASLWKLSAGGRLTEILRTAQGAANGYQGSVFALDPAGSIYFLHRCRVVRLAVDGQFVPVAGNDCGARWWDDDAVRYGHLHGSLAWGPDGTLYFSAGRTVRKIRAGAIATLAGDSATLFDEPHVGEQSFGRVMGLAVSAQGGIYVADRHRVAKLDSSGSNTTVVKSGWLWSASGLSIAGGDVFLVEERTCPPFLCDLFGSPRVRKVEPDGTTVTLAQAGGEFSWVIVVAFVALPAALLGLQRVRRRQPSEGLP